MQNSSEVKNGSLCVLVLVKNELPNIKATLNNTLAVSKEIGADVVFIDGKSDDGSVEYLRENNVSVIQQVDSGRGNAASFGISTLPYDYFIIYSPDGNEDIEDLRIFKKFLNENKNLVIASRMLADSINEEDDQLFKPRKLANNFFNWIANKTFNRSGTYVSDSINGYRMIKRSLFLRLGVDAPGYTFEYQMTMRAMKLGIEITEFPTKEYARLHGDTQAKSIPTGIQFLRAYFKEFLTVKNSG